MFLQKRLNNLGRHHRFATHCQNHFRLMCQSDRRLPCQNLLQNIFHRHVSLLLITTLSDLHRCVSFICALCYATVRARLQASLIIESTLRWRLRHSSYWNQWKQMNSLQHGVATHFGATLLLPMIALLVSSSQCWLCVDADAWYKKFSYISLWIAASEKSPVPATTEAQTVTVSPGSSVASSSRSSVKQKSTNMEINNTIKSINEIRHSLMDPSKRTNLSPTTG